MTTPDNCEHGRDEPSVCLCGAAPEGTYPAGYLDEIRQQLDALAAEYGDGDLSLSEWRAASKPLMERLRQIEEAHLSPGEALPELFGEDNAAYRHRHGGFHTLVGSVRERLLQTGLSSWKRPFEHEPDVPVQVNCSKFGEMRPSAGQLAVAEIASVGTARLDLQM